jgi:diaminohydroxyphosphoribosylaminopyrimidine deaminase / 5-amino-6-(5-phosphoribosylamino)uracil reductase
VALLPSGSLDDALSKLRRDFGVRSLLVEGGAGLAGALWAADLVDRLIIFQAPVVLGRGALAAFGEAPGARAEGARRLPIVERRTFDDDLMTVYAVHSPEAR